MISHIGGDKAKILKIFDKSDLNYGSIVKYLSDELKNDKDIIIPVCLKYPYAFEDAGEKIRDNKDVIKE